MKVCVIARYWNSIPPSPKHTLICTTNYDCDDKTILIVQRIRYRYNVRTKQCYKHVLNDTFRPFSIPFDAKFVDRLEIGSNAVAGAGVEVDVWEGNTPGN